MIDHTHQQPSLPSFAAAVGGRKLANCILLLFLFFYHFAGFPAACLKCLCDPAMPEDPDDNQDDMAGKLESVPTLTDSENHSGTSSENGTEATVWIT